LDLQKDNGCWKTDPPFPKGSTTEGGGSDNIEVQNILEVMRWNICICIIEV
jgi:hypothetical protein